MILDVKFEESKTTFDCDFVEVHNISDGGFERGLAEGERIGYEKGSAEGYSQGEADGRKTEYDAFWDSFQDYGNRVDYEYAFVALGWTTKNFKPKYDIRPTGSAIYMFGINAFKNNGEKVDLTELLENAGVTLDLSNATNADYAFRNSYIKRVPIIDASKTLINLGSIFAFAYDLETVDGIILNNEGTNTFNSAFTAASALREIKRIDGVIGNNIELNYCTLSKESIARVINALSTETSGISCKFSKYRVNKEFETAQGKNDGSTSTEWLDLIATKPNWTISLA